MIRGGKISKTAGIVLGVASALRTEPLAVIYRKARVLSPAILQFVQFLKQSSGLTH